MIIADFLEAKLKLFNAENHYIKNVTADDYCGRISRSIEKLNRNIEKVSICIDEVEFDKSELATMAIPDAFKQKPIIYESFASDGTSFALVIS